MADKPGYIALYRKIQDNFLWHDRRIFSRAEAWIDMLMEVRWREDIQQVLIGNRLYSCGYGQSLNSHETWGKRWNWSPSKVLRFFKLLSSCRMIVTENVSVTTRITICNFREYQKSCRASEEQVKSICRASEEHVTTEEEGKEGEEVNKEKKDVLRTSARNRGNGSGPTVLKPTKRIALNLESYTWEGIESDDRARWMAAYPGCDLDIELARMAEWIRSNPGKIKRNWLRFITNWLSRTQERGGTKTAATITPRELTWAEKRKLRETIQ